MKSTGHLYLREDYFFFYSFILFIFYLRNRMISCQRNARIFYNVFRQIYLPWLNKGAMGIVLQCH